MLTRQKYPLILIFGALALWPNPVLELQAQQRQNPNSPPDTMDVRQQRDRDLANIQARIQNGQATTVYQLPPTSPAVLALWRDFYTQSPIFGKRHRRVVGDAYRDILQQWSAQTDMNQVKLLTELELRMRSNFACYEAEQRRIIQTLTTRTPGALLPLASLHMLAWQEDLNGRRTDRLDHSSKRINELMIEHVKSLDDSEQGRQEAAALLTHLAERVWSSGYARLFDSALSNLKVALDLRPDHHVARHFRAVLYERLGQYRKSARDLKTLLKSRPNDSEVSLRLAVQYARLSQNKDAAEILQDLLNRHGQIPKWVHVVALQERIRLLAGDNQEAQARRLITQAMDLYPRNERFVLMSVDLERRQGATAGSASRRLLDQWHQDTGVSPRLRYLQGPLLQLESNRDYLLASLPARHALLASGLRHVGTKDRGLLACGGSWRLLKPQETKKSQAGRRAPKPKKPAPITAGSVATGSAASVSFDNGLDLSAPIRPATPDTETEAGRQETMEAALDTRQSGVYVDPATGQSYRVDEVMDLELQQIYVSPPARSDLKFEASQIEVIDNGRRQEIVTFETGNIPFTATLLIDASSSMRGPRMKRALDGARVFNTAMVAHDRTRILLAADRVRGVSSFFDAEDFQTADLAERLDRSQAAGGTALYDHLFLALDALQPEQGRKVVIVLSDGFDTLSAVPMDSVREAVRRSQIQLYWVRILEGDMVRRDFVPLTGWRPRDETSRSLSLFQRTIKESGGRTVEIYGAHQVADGLTRILEDLRRQIAIGYYPNNSKGDGQWHEVQVKNRRPGARLRHAAGYFDG